MNAKWIAAAAGALAVTFAASADAQRPGWQGGWHVIGLKVVNGGTDTDAIYTPGRQNFRQLRVCAYNAPLRMRDFDVYFANGGHQDVNTRERLGAGTCTRAIGLNGRGRDIT